MNWEIIPPRYVAIIGHPYPTSAAFSLVFITILMLTSPVSFRRLFKTYTTCGFVRLIKNWQEVFIDCSIVFCSLCMRYVLERSRRYGNNVPHWQPFNLFPGDILCFHFHSRVVFVLVSCEFSLVIFICY